MAGSQLERSDDNISEEDEVELTPRQISALEKLDELGAAPRQDSEEPYSSDAKIRAYQMIFEGRLGGPGRGQGRKSEKDRVNRVLAERFRRKVAKLEKVIDEALDDDNIKVAMDAVRLVADLDAKDAAQSLKEEQHQDDVDRMDKEGLILALFEQFQDPQVEAAIRARGEVLDLPASSVREIPAGSSAAAFQEAVVVSDDASGEPEGSAAAPARSRVRRGSVDGDGREPAPRDAGGGANPWKAAARRRAAD